MSTDRFLRTFDGPAHVLVYEALTAPPAADGAQGDYALCFGGGTVPAVYGPKTSASVWPAAVSMQGPSGASAIADWTTGTAYAAQALAVFNGHLYRAVSAHTAAAAFRTDLAAGKWALLDGTGRIESVDPLLCASQTTWSAVNRVGYWRCAGGGAISKVGLDVEVSSGNIAVAAYADNNGAPGTLLAASASVACPAVSSGAIQTVALGSTVGFAAGDWLALWCDNTTASFRCATTAAIGGTAYAGRAAFETAASGPPATATPTVGSAKGILLTAS